MTTGAGGKILTRMMSAAKRLFGREDGVASQGYTPDFDTVFAAELERLCDDHAIGRLDLNPLPADGFAPAMEIGPAPSRDDVMRMAAPRESSAKNAPPPLPHLKSNITAVRRTELSALALSGGGIRSAAFACGVMQAMAQNAKLECFDYLSTVSGGGYSGSALTWALHDQINRGANDFPDLKIRRRSGRVRPDCDGRAEELRDDWTEVTLIGHIRERASYLAPTQDLNLLTAIGNTIRLSLSSLLIYSLIAFSVMLPVTVVFGAISSFVHWLLVALGRADTSPTYLAPQTLISGACAVLVAAVVYFAGILLWPLLRSLRPSNPESTYAGRLKILMSLNDKWTCILAAALGATFPLLYEYLSSQGIASILSLLGSLGFAGGLSGLLSLIARLDDRLRILLVRAAALILCYLAAFALYAATLMLLRWVAQQDILPALVAGALCILAVIIVFWASGRFNPNYISPHRFYRDRLMEAFMPPANGKDFAQSDVANLSDMCKTQPQSYRGPYHIINTNIILNRSRQPRYYQRGGDSFILSPLYSGSLATGWLRTERQSRSARQSSLSLATAMAISAAAANPNTATGDDGLMRRWAISFLMTLLNIRLGYWQPNPGMQLAADSAGTPPPNFLQPGVMSLLSDYGSEGEAFVELSDGGHFDNTGLYELFRRRVSVIVLSDASCDPDYSLDDLGRALALAQIDFGVTVRFYPMPPGASQDLWRQLDRDPDEPGAYRGKGYPVISDGVRAKLLHDGFVSAKIYYPAAEGRPESEGRLIYLKPALVSDAPVDLLAYALDHRDFPHRPTGDQFFSERGFESYRRLGFFIAEKMMKSEFA